MRTQVPEHPVISRDLTNVFNFGTGRKVRKDVKATIAHGAPSGNSAKPAPAQRMRELKYMQKKEVWRHHQSFSHSRKGRCAWVNCPGLNLKAKRKRSFETFMRCEECSACVERDIFLCNVMKNGQSIYCHIAYHRKYHNEKYEDEL